MALSVGQQVWIPCKVQPGPFAEEPLVTVESLDGPVSGFVSTDEIQSGSHGEKRVRGIVRNITGKTVEVWIKGSFFTTNGLTNVPKEMALAA